MKFLFSALLFAAGVFALPEGKAVFFNHGMPKLNMVDLKNGFINCSLSNPFNLSSLSGIVNASLQFHYYAPLPYGEAGTSTSGPVYDTINLTSVADGLWDIDGPATSNIAQIAGNLTGPSWWNILGTSVTLNINNDTDLETQVLGVSNAEAGSDIPYEEVNYFGFAAFFRLFTSQSLQRSPFQFAVPR